MSILQDWGVRGGPGFSLYFVSGHAILPPADLFPCIMKSPLPPEALENLIRHFDSVERVIPLQEYEVRGSLSLESSIMLQPRLERAAMNQLTDGDATLSRYAIWAETVRGIVLDALEQMDGDSDTKRNLTRAANSLGAFAAIQQQLSPM